MARKKAAQTEEKVDWHRLFGMVLTDYFTNSPYEVETEFDLSKKKQFLDVVIIRSKRSR